MWYYNADHPLRRYFSGLTEQTFIDALGVADPGLVDYLSLASGSFRPHRRPAPARTPTRARLSKKSPTCSWKPRRCRPAAPAARSIATSATTRSSGPASIPKRSSGCAPSCTRTISSITATRASVPISSPAPSTEDPYRDEAPVLRRLSEQFELCAYGLSQVRKEWEQVRAAKK